MLLSSIQPLTAQTSKNTFRHITVSNGLINDRITALCRDKEGFIWIGTQYGLQRYDGTRFKNYYADVRDTAALQSDWISAIFQDSKQRLWVGNDNGAPYILNRATGKFYNYNLHDSAANKITGIWQFAEDKTGVLWIAGHEGCYRLNGSTNKFEKYNLFLGLGKYSNPGGLTFDTDNNIWLNTQEGIKFYNRTEKKLYSQAYNPNHNPVFDVKELGGEIVINKSVVWFNGNRILYRYDFSTDKISSFTFDKPTSKKHGSKFQQQIIAGIFCSSDGKIIVPLAGGGLALYNKEKNKFLIIEAENTKAYAYHEKENSEGRIDLLQDHEKNILIGSSSGINIFNPEKQYFKIHGNDNNKSLFPNELVSDFIEMPDGTIFISYYNVNGGIVEADSNFNFKKQYLFNDKGNINNTSNQIWNLFNDTRGNIWAPNQSNTILKLNIQKGEILEEKDNILKGPINIINKDNEGNIWMGHWSKGLVKQDAITHKYSFYNDFLQTAPSFIKRVQCLLIEGDKIWAGTLQNGLLLFDKKKERFTEAFATDQNNKNSISSNCVTDILRYDNNTLVLATLMGINIFDVKAKTFKTISSKEGLPNNLVQAVIKDDLGNVWVACYEDGLCKINMKDLSITNYGVNDGIIDNIFTSKFYKLKNGNLLMGTSQRFFSFNPASFIESSPPPDVHITGLYVFEKEIPADSFLKNNKPIILTYNENAIRIEFSSLEYWNPEGIKYLYKLEGVDKNWITADKNNTAIYNQLTNGHYTFNIKSRNREGYFSIHTTRLKIHIKPPFQKTWWFISLLILLAILLIYFFINWRERNIKTIAAEKLKVQKLNAEKYKNKLELEQIINYFSSSLIDKNTVDDVLWNVAKNLIGRLGFVDCMIYVWNNDKTKMVQKAGLGPKDSIEEINKLHFDVAPGQGLVGHVMQTKTPVIIPDTSKDSRYRYDDIIRLSEITVPIIYNNELLGVIDSEHPEKNFYTQQHLQILTTIATLTGNKIKSIEADQSLQQTQIEMYSMNELLSKAKLEALRSQMNPHFIFNSLNAIQECILTSKIDAAYKYLSEFSKLQRMVLNNSQLELIPLGSEIEMLQLYLSLESLRFSKSFIYSINTTNIADINEIMIPSLITQPIVENAIWHGLRNKEGDKKLEIIYEEKDGKIFITIDDDGIGREKAAIIRKQKLGSGQFVSKGTTLLLQRLHVLSQQLKADIKLDTIDKKDASGNPSGTKVIIYFPANLQSN